MNVKIIPSKTSGQIYAPPSKSYAHRYIISAFLSKSEGIIKNVGTSKDVLATLNALSSIGLKYEILEENVKISFCEPQKNAVLDCYESGSTLRFLFPLVCALGLKASFTGSEKLLSRPMKDLTDCLIANGAKINGFKVSGKLKSGEYKINGGVSSQFISGLMFALPLLDGDSKIIIDGEEVSKDYLLVTKDVLSKFNVIIEKTDYGYFVKGNQKYDMPKEMTVEGDYSGASFILTLGALGDGVTVLNLNENSLQGDKKIIDVLSRFGAIVEKVDNGYFVKRNKLKGITVDCENIPDLVQILSVLASFSKGKSKFLNVSRLKIKESDRILGIINNLKNAKIKAKYHKGNLIVYGGKPKAGTFSGDNDHRTVMSAVVLASQVKDSSVVLGAEAINKSYPSFFRDFIALGGKVDGDI